MEFCSIVILVQCKAERSKNLGPCLWVTQGGHCLLLGPVDFASLRLLGQAAGASSTALWLNSAQFQLLTLFDFFVCLYFTATQTTTLLIYGLHWLADNNLDHSQFLFSGSVLVPSSNFVSTTCWIFFFDEICSNWHSAFEPFCVLKNDSPLVADKNYFFFVIF